MIATPTLRQVADAGRFLAADQQHKFLSQKQRTFFRDVQERFVAGPEYPCRETWTPGIGSLRPIPYEVELNLSNAADCDGWDVDVRRN